MLPSYQSWWGQSNIQLSPQNLISNIIHHEFKESCNFMSVTKKKKKFKMGLEGPYTCKETRLLSKTSAGMLKG